MKVSVKKDRTAEFRKLMDSLVRKRVLVGIPSDKAAREDGGTFTNADIGFVSEFGAPDANIPARPVLIPGVNKAVKRVSAAMVKAAEAALSKRSPDNALHQAGIAAVASIKKHIRSGDGFKPLAEATIKARVARGRKGTKPLIDTGSFINSFTYSIEDR